MIEQQQDHREYRRIATEEAWAPPELFETVREMLTAAAVDDPDLKSLMGYYAMGDSDRPQFIRRRMTDTDSIRLEEMETAGIDHQILSLTSPGVNPLAAQPATELAQLSNNRL